jgi:hypothetical protein
MTPLVTLLLSVIFSIVETTFEPARSTFEPPLGDIRDGLSAFRQSLLIVSTLLVGLLAGFYAIIARLRHGFRGILGQATIGTLVCATFLLAFLIPFVAGFNEAFHRRKMTPSNYRAPKSHSDLFRDPNTTAHVGWLSEPSGGDVGPT